LLPENIQSQTITTSLSTVQDITHLDIGFNRRSDNGIWWTDNSFINLVSQMQPEVVRYPGGTQANYWDWHTGKFIPNAGKNWGNKEVLHIPEFLNALPADTKVIYVVNMARPTPSTGIDVNASEAVLKSQTTLNAKITDMLNAIAEFVANGREPYAVELGNEFYFGNEEGGIFYITQDNNGWHAGWDSVNNQSFVSPTKQEATVVNAKFYLDQCKQIVAAIKAVYPNMKFALTTSKMGNGNSARESWNNTIINELNNNSNYATLAQSIYAFTQHHYIKDNYGSSAVVNNNNTSKIAIAEGIQYPLDKQPDYDLVPNNYKIWYTEFGVTKENAELTWVTGMRYAALVYSWLSLGNKIGQLDYHYITDDNVVKTGSPMKLAPIGIAAKLVSSASKDMTQMQKIVFSNNPVAANGILSLYGYKFKNNNKETLLIINLNSTDFSQIQVDNLFTYTGQADITQYYSNAPYVSDVFEGNPNIHTVSGTLNNTFTAKKFSITVIQKNNSSGISEANDVALKFFPNPVDDILYVNQTPVDVTILNINGQKVFSKKNIHKKIDVSNLPNGIYFIKSMVNNKVFIQKIIKQ